MGFGQFAATTQFLLYGRRHFTATGWLRASAKYQGPALESVDLKGKVFVVTGANSGCGLELSLFLARRGARLYMVCRNRERAEKALLHVTKETSSTDVEILIADVGLASDVRELVKSIAKTEQAVDGLVCNAGALLSDRQLTHEGFEMTFATHLLHGSYLLATELLPLLHRSKAPRVVFVSSGGMYNTPWPGWQARPAA